MLLRVHYAVLGIRPVLHRGLGAGCSGHLHRVTAAIAKGKHPVPSRTRKLSLSAPMVLRGRPRGRAGHRRNTFRRRPTHHGSAFFVFPAVVKSTAWPYRGSTSPRQGPAAQGEAGGPTHGCVPTRGGAWGPGGPGPGR